MMPATTQRAHWEARTNLSKPFIRASVPGRNNRYKNVFPSLQRRQSRGGRAIKKNDAEGHQLDTGALKTTEEKAEVPSLDKEGWLRRLRKCREASLAGADVWLVQATDYRKLNEPPRPRLQRNGTIYLMARPPLLCRNCQATFCFHHRDWFSFATMRSAWAGDRAMLGSNPSADPGANTEAGYRYGYPV